MVPRKLQRQLPYRDKPKFAPLKADRKPDPEKKRVAVVREPHEQKVIYKYKIKYNVSKPKITIIVLGCTNVEDVAYVL